MNSILITGSVVVTLALISYSIGVITEQIVKKITPRVLIFITAGIILDVTATLFMIIGSPNSPFTLHGFLGYSALAVMLIDVALIWRLKLKKGMGAGVSPALHVYSRYAYLWWVAAYFTGALLVMI